MCESAHGQSAAKRSRANWQCSCVHVSHTIMNVGWENGDASSVVAAMQQLAKPFQKPNKWLELEAVGNQFAKALRTRDGCKVFAMELDLPGTICPIG